MNLQRLIAQHAARQRIKCGANPGCALLPGTPGALEQGVRPNDIGANERVGAADRPVNVGLSREMCNDGDPLPDQEISHQFLVTDITVDERIPRVPLKSREIGIVARVGEGIENYQSVTGTLLEPEPDEVRPDEACPARYQDATHRLPA